MAFVKIKMNLYNVDHIIKIGYIQNPVSKKCNPSDKLEVTDVCGIYVELTDSIDKFKTQTPEEAFALMTEVEKLLK